MNPRVLATILLRCSGLISMVVGLCSTAAYLPMIWDVDFSHGSAGALRSVLLPSLAAVIAGLLVFTCAGFLGRLASKGFE